MEGSVKGKEMSVDLSSYSRKEVTEMREALAKASSQWTFWRGSAYCGEDALASAFHTSDPEA